MIEEKDKYQGIYSNPDKYPRYGHSNHGSRAVSIVRKLAPQSVLDVGCGFNEFNQQVKTILPQARTVGTDFACPGADIQCDAMALPFTEKEFDLVTAFDMLEHLPEVEVDQVLSEMNRTAKRFIFSISYQDSVTRWQGQTLHPTVKPEEWWVSKLAKAGALEISKQGRYLTGRWDTPLRMHPESSVVLVGNGPSVQDSPLGRIIDTFDEVVRFNDFKIEGFEDFVGTKTTLWSTFFRGVETPDKHPKIICLHENAKAPDTVNEVYRVPNWIYARTRRAVTDRAFWKSGLSKESTILASSGLQIAVFLLEVVGVKKVHLYGFDHFTKHRSSQHHYWLPNAFKRPAEHDGDIEAELFNELRLAGRVAYL